MSQPPRRKSNDGMPPGVNRDASPLWEFTDDPINLLQYVLRYHEMTNAILHHTKIDKVQNKHIKVLDIGCGRGEMLRFLRRCWKAKGCRIDYLGYDADAWKLKEANRIFAQDERAEFYRCDIRKASDFPKCDVAILSETLEHVSRKEGQELLKKIHNAADWIVGTVPAPCKRSNPWHFNECTTDQLLTYLLDAGFKIEFIGWMDTRYDSKLAGPYMPKAVFRHYKGMRPNATVGDDMGNWTFFVGKSKRKIKLKKGVAFRSKV